MRMLALHQYLPIRTIKRLDTKRLDAELKTLGYALASISGTPAAGNNRLWLVGPNSTTRDDDAIRALDDQAKRLRIMLQ